MLSCSKGRLERRCLRSLLTEWQTELGDRRASRRESLLRAHAPARNASGAWELADVSRSLDEGLYMDHLRRWWRIFTRERVHVVLSDALFSEPLSAVRCDIRRGDRAARCLARVEAPANRSAHAPALRSPISHPRTTRQLAQVNRVLRILDLEPLLALPANTSTRPTSEDACMDARCDTMRNELRSSFFGAPRDAQSRRFFDELAGFYERDGRLLASALQEPAPANWTAARWLEKKYKKPR